MNKITQDALLVAPRQDLIDIIQQLLHKNEQLESHIQKLQFDLNWLKGQMFGAKSERYVADGLQQTLELNVPSVPVKVESQPVGAHSRKKVTPAEGHGRGAMPTHLPIKDVVIEPQEDVSGCVRMGEEITWEYDYNPDSLFVRRYIRPKYARRDETRGVAIGELPARPVEKGNMGPGLLAAVAVDKYVYHTPLDRQRRKYEASYEVRFSESHLVDSVRRVGFWIEPVYLEMAKDIIGSTYLQADETSIKVLWHELKGKARTGWYWGYNDPINKILVFDFRMDRSREGPNEFLRKFKGVLQVDDYAGYNDVRKRLDILWAACMAHVRRKFNDALPYDPERGKYALEVMQQWFAHESTALSSEFSVEQKLDMRQSLVKPSMDEFHLWLKEQLHDVLPKSPMGKAIAYAINQWPGFAPYLSDGRVELSNNLNENNMRPIAVGRKNYMFKGSPDAAQRGAMIYSVLGTAQKHKLEPWQYLTDLLTYLPRVNTSCIRDFLPYNWVHQREKYVGDSTEEST